MKNKILLIITLALTQIAFAEKIDIAVLSPMIAEGSVFVSQMRNVNTVTINNNKYNVGFVGNKKVVQTTSGIGKVNATIAAVNLINNYHPKILFLEGTAGAINTHLKIGTVILGGKVYALERDRTNTSNETTVSPGNLSSMPSVFLDPNFINNLSKIKNIQYPVLIGKIATTDNLPSTLEDLNLLKVDKADVVEMEGAAIMQVGWIYKIPTVVIRSNSNVALTDIHKAVFTKEGLDISTHNAADFTKSIIQHI